MLYLEDYLEMIEHLPQELRDRFTEMRELDLSVQNCLDTLENRMRLLFMVCRRPDANMDQANVEFADIRRGYNKALEDADEKVHLANELYDLVERYLRRLDTELHKFKCELEADNKGITEVLEKRSLEMDIPPVVNQMPQSSSHHQHKDSRYRIRPEKRRDSWGGSVNTVTNNSGNRSSESSMSGGTTRNDGRTLVTATTPLTLSRTDLALQAVVGRAVENATPGNYGLGHMGAGTAIAAAASQAIVATQQMQQGRRTASLKASYEAIHSGAAGVGLGATVLAPGELQIGRDLTGAAQQALQVVQHQDSINSLPSVSSNVHMHSHSQSSSANRRHKKKTSYGGTSSGNNVMLHVQQTLTSSLSRSSSPTHSVGNIGVSNAAPITSMPLEDSMMDGDWALDPNEPRYCICNQVSYGDMVACDNEECRYEWFHYACVGVTAPPKGKWYCPQCLTNMRRRGNRKN